MTALLELKQRIKMLYAKYDIYLIPAAKFIIALVAFLMINSRIGFMEKLANPVVAVLLALLCSFLPVNMIAIFGALLVCAHAFALSIEVLAVAAGIFFLMYAVYFRVCPGQGYVLVLTPLAFVMGIPYAMPLVLGLVGGPVCAVPMAFGTIAYYLMYYMKNNETMITNSETETMATRMTYLVENVLNNKAVIMTILIMAIVLMVVYAIRKMSADYAWYMAIGSGAVLNIVLFLTGGLVMEVRISVIGLVLGTAVSLLIAMIVEFFAFSVDYSRTEYAQFEDDEYYYYVKAVPKMSISIPDKKVKKINTRRNRSSRKKH